MEDISDVKTIFTQEHVLSWKNLAMALRINERCVEVSFYSLSRLLNEDNQKETACIFPCFFRKKLWPAMVDFLTPESYGS